MTPSNTPNATCPRAVMDSSTEPKKAGGGVRVWCVGEVKLMDYSINKCTLYVGEFGYGFFILKAHTYRGKKTLHH